MICKTSKFLNELNIGKFKINQTDFEKSLSREYRKKNGIYYTSYELADSILNEITLDKNAVVLDPCCGMGSFLISALRRGYSNIYGVEKDKETTNNLLKLLNTKNSNIIIYDSINNPAESTLSKLGIQKADIIVGNPPYIPSGGIYGNTFIGSLIRSLDMLKDDGILSYIIPKNFLHIKTYQELRKRILKEYQIISIIDIGIYFKNVRGEQIVLTIKKSKPMADQTIQFKEINNNRFILNSKINQEIFTDIIRIIKSSKELTIFDKLSSTYETLEDYYTGYIGRGRSKSVEAISGRDLKKFGFKSLDIPTEGNKIFIQNIYSAEAGIIGSFAGNLEAKETVTVLTGGTPNKCKYLVGILHSRLINYFLHKYIFNGSKLAMHTDKKYLSDIPIIIAKGEKFDEVVRLVSKLETLEYLEEDWYDTFEKLNKLVYKIYKINKSEKKYIEKYIINIQSGKWIGDDR